MNLNVAHVHLLLNHFPTVGLVVALSLFLVALAKGDSALERIGLGLLVVMSLLTLPVYISGNAADTAIADLPGVSATMVLEHHDAALLAFALMEGVGVVAWLGLWQVRQSSRLPRWNVAAVALLSIVTLAFMARTATMGGEIRHPEIRPGSDITTSDVPGVAGAGWLTSTAVAAFAVGYAWVWQAGETVHFIGMCLLMGVVLVVNLRVLGMIKRVSFPALHRLLPVAVLGFGLNTVSGMLFFVTNPEQYTQNPTFFLKVAFIFLAGLQVFYLTVSDKAWVMGPGDDAAVIPKIMAASGLILWFGVVFWGTMLPFLRF